MRKLSRICCLPVLILLTVISSEAFEVEEVTLVVTHRMYQNFREEHTVKLGERFFLSDTEYSAEAVEFVPDFAIDLEKNEVISRSDEPNNPAVRVIVYQNDEQVDEIWAFGETRAPHFYRDSFLAFQILDYRPPSQLPDSEEESTSDVRTEGRDEGDRRTGETKE